MKTLIRTALCAFLVIALAGLTGCDGPTDPPDGPSQPTTVGAAGQAVGAAPLGTTAYAIPAGSTFVSPTGSDSAAGTQADPLRTVARGIYKAAPGTTLVLRAGTYRERVDFPSTKRLTMQPFPYETVWFSGSVAVGGWTPNGSAWIREGWTQRFPRDGLNDSMLIGADPRAGFPDMVFIDGHQLKQVASRSAVVADTFFLNESTSQLFIGSDPTGHNVEASVLAEGLNVQSSGSLVRGLGFTHYATSIQDAGAVRGWNNVTFENDVFTQNATGGLTLRGNDIVRRVTSTFNGQLGIATYQATGAVIQDSVISNNNTDNFNPESATGGVKVFNSTYVTLRGNVANDNYGHGLWFDGHSDHAVAVRNIARRNARGAGVMFELGQYALIAGNIATDNEAGLQAGEASDVQVWNNTLVNNEYAFSGYQGVRAQPVRITVRNNIFGAGPTSDRPVLINYDATSSRSWIDMAWTSDYNAFYRQSTVVTRQSTVMANWPSGQLSFTNVAQIASGTSQESHSIATDNVANNPYIVSATTGDFRAPSASQTNNRGTALPADVATAINQPAGVTVDIGAPIG